ncbi:MAG: hypothetical protein IJA14_02255 [Alphaproteobacteria bacterium]|nr:hypothetical protein [Alphaproteobacteria bacterium]
MHIESLKDHQKSSFYIAKFENAIDDEKKIEEASFNCTVYLAYYKNKASERELIDFDDVIWTEDVEEIITTLKENGINIKEFTISCKFCDLIDRLAAFEKLGCKIKGTTELLTSWTDLNGRRQKITALKMEIL